MKDRFTSDQQRSSSQINFINVILLTFRGGRAHSRVIGFKAFSAKRKTIVRIHRFRTSQSIIPNKKSPGSQPKVGEGGQRSARLNNDNNFL